MEGADGGCYGNAIHARREADTRSRQIMRWLPLWHLTMIKRNA
jgi:hypothetical protein